MLSLSVSLGIFFLAVLSPSTMSVEISKKGKRCLSITGFIAIISPAEKRLMRLSSYWNLHFNKHQQPTWAGHREWPSIKKSLAWYLFNSHIPSKKIIPNMENQSSLFLLLTELLTLLEKWALCEINCMFLTKNILKEILRVQFHQNYKYSLHSYFPELYLEKKVSNE